MLHQTLHRHTEELLFAQWSSLPKWIKAGKEQVGGSRRENPKTGAWSRAGPNNVCYTNRAIPHHVCETSTQRDNCISPHTERTEETLKSQIWKQQRHLYICSTTFVFHVFRDSRRRCDLFLCMGTASIHGYWTHAQIPQQLDKPSQSTTWSAILLFSNCGWLQ